MCGKIPPMIPLALLSLTAGLHWFSPRRRTAAVVATADVTAVAVNVAVAVAAVVAGGAPR